MNALISFFKKFEPIDWLLFAGVFSLAAGTIYLSINPAQELHRAWDNERKTELNLLLEAIAKTQGVDRKNLFSAIPIADTCAQPTNEICRPNTDCNNRVDISLLLGKYLKEIPVDPLERKDSTGTGYYISRKNDGTITICASRSKENLSVSASP